jgi:hypothetical protein
MGDNLNPDAELERLREMHEQIARLREKVRVLKEKEVDVHGGPTPDDEEASDDVAGSHDLSKITDRSL